MHSLYRSSKRMGSLKERHEFGCSHAFAMILIDIFIICSSSFKVISFFCCCFVPFELARFKSTAFYIELKFEFVVVVFFFSPLCRMFDRRRRECELNISNRKLADCNNAQQISRYEFICRKKDTERKGKKHEKHKTARREFVKMKNLHKRNQARKKNRNTNEHKKIIRK